MPHADKNIGLENNSSQTNISRFKTYILVGCVAAATLGLELVQTRILSFLYFNNVVYLTVTVALLGFGISGVLVSLFAEHFKNPQRVISLLTAGFIFAPIICLSMVSRIPTVFPTSSITINKLLISYIAMVIPFLFSGAILGWIFMIHAKSINRLYCVDLACSSGAVIAFILLLWPLGGDWFMWFCSGITLIGFLYYSHQILSKDWVLSIIFVYFGSMLMLNGNLLGKMPEQYKTLGVVMDANAKFEATHWTPNTRIDLISNPNMRIFYTSREDTANLKLLTQDGDAATTLYGPKMLSSFVQAANNGKLIGAVSLIYHLNKNPKNALVIGVGGGIDMLTAKIMGAQSVTGVEINPATVSMITGPYRNYIQWPNWQRVKIIRAEGRNYVHSKHNSYDTIVMSGIDTFSALSSGAYVLSENYLYTVEAIEDYLHALKPNGVMAIHRWFFLQPRESLRLSSLYIEAAKKMQIAHPDQSIMIISDDLGWQRWATTFIKKTPFTPAEVLNILALSAKDPTHAVIYIPNVFPVDVQKNLEEKVAAKSPEANFARQSFNRLIRSSDLERTNFIRDYVYRIDPVYDNQPFFFEYFKENSFNSLKDFFSALSSARGPTVLYTLLVICSILCLSCIIFPLWVFQKRGLKTPGAVSLLLFFASLGFGYMMFEIGAMQLVNVYIGDPTYSLPLILAGLLVSTGIGSIISAKFSNLSSLPVIATVALAIATAIILWTGFTNIVQPLTMDFAIVYRAAIVLFALIPVGILLGIPFPTAIREIEKQHSNFIPWAWGVNGVTSVLASVVAIIIAMKVGFTITVLSAAVAYVLGMITYWSYFRKSQSEPYRYF